MSMSLGEYKIIVETAPNLIWRSGIDAKCYYFNKTWLDFVGRTLKQEYGDGWLKGVHPDDLDRCIKIYQDNFNKRTPFAMEYRLLRHDGEWRWIDDRGVPVIDEGGEFTGFIGSCLDVTDKVEGLTLKEMAQKDGLTGIFSRQYWLSLFEYEFELAKRSAGKLAVAMMDIDKFKHINDIYGHSDGDAALKMLASVVNDNIRQNDLFGRYGGDEFIIGFPDTTIEMAKGVVDRITSSLKTTVLDLDHAKIEISISVGLCELMDEDNPDEMILKADKRMYENKKRKQNL